MPKNIHSDNTFDSMSKEWLFMMTPCLKISSVAKYNNILSLYLLPRFKDQQIEDISRDDIIQLIRELLVSGGTRASGLSPKTVKSVLSLMKNIMEYASREKGLQIADIRNIPIKQSQKPMRILSCNEQRILSKYLRENITPCNLGILLSLYTGLRIGELCALKWEDINISERYIYVHRTMQRIQIEQNSTSKTAIIIQPPKSDCSIRKIPIPNEILKLLQSMEKRGNSYFLTGEADRYVEPRNMTNHFKAAAEECNIANVNYHALRHTFATRCVELGFDIRSLSEILGHASINITLNRYVHPSMDLKQRNMDMLSDLLGK